MLLIGNSLFCCYWLLFVAFFFTFLALMLPFPRLCLQGRAYLIGIHLGFEKVL